MTEQTTPRRARKQPTTEAGRQLLAAAREQLAQEEARIAEAMTREAKRRLSTRSAITLDEAGKRDVAVQRGIVKRVAAALGSESVVPLFNVEPAMRMQAYTDFEQIVVRYVSHDDIALLAATLRGLLYHEGGHIRWTWPFDELMARAGVIPGTMTGVETTALHHSWNALEDQRMETAVTSDSPRKAAFFTPMMLTELLNTPERATANWPLLIWRRYLPKHIRDGARAMFVAINGEQLALDMERVVDSYVKATDAATMWAAVLDFSKLLQQAQTTSDTGQVSKDHRNQNSTNTNPGERSQIPIDPKQDADEQQGAGEGDEAQGEDESKGETQGAGKAAGKGETEAQGGDESQPGAGGGPSKPGGQDTGQGTAEGADEGQGGKGAGTSGTHGDDDRGLTQQDINEAINDAEQERLNDSSVQNDVEAYHDSKDSTASQMAPYMTNRWDDADEAVADAEHLADDMVQAFAATTMDRQPGWVEDQRSGVLNVGRYITRNDESDLNIFRQYMDDDQPGQNLAVSVLLDYSGSMNHSERQLAQVGYACKRACDRLDIPCTVLLWDTDAKTLWDATERADDGMPVVHVNGGTNPDRALADLDNHRNGKVRHLVLLMTDGAWGWGSERTLATYSEGRYILGVGYSKAKASADSYAEALRRYGCNEAIGITDLLEIPRALELLLIDMA